MRGIDRIAELRALARLAADRAQAQFARREAEQRRLRADMHDLEHPQTSEAQEPNPISDGQVTALWDQWRRLRIEQLNDALATNATLCNQARTKAARLEAKVRAVDKMLAGVAVEEKRKQRNRALRQGLPEE